MASNIFSRRLGIGGPGARVAVKDTIDIAGYPTVGGSRALADAKPAERNAEVVDRLLAAGCRIVGKTNLHELAFGVTGINDWTGTPVNPAYPDLVPGGSSSGSAAVVAAAEADFALGTDTGGSIRVPAACCGVFGLKPTFGRVSRTGVAPRETSLDCVGPFGASIDWLVAAMGIIDPGFAPEAVAAPVLGLVDAEADPLIADAVAGAVAASGMAARAVALPGMGQAFAAGLTIINAETFAAFGSLLETGLVGEDVAVRLAAAGQTTREDVAAAETVRARFQAEVDAALDRCDVLVLPTLPIAPPRRDTARTDRSSVNLTTLVRPFNLSGHPALSMPVGRAAVVASLQLVGRRGADARLCAIGTAIAKALESGGDRGPLEKGRFEREAGLAGG